MPHVEGCYMPKDQPQPPELTPEQVESLKAMGLWKERIMKDCWPPDAFKPSEPPDHTNIATEAAKLVCGDRNDSYGDPADDYAGTAKVWSGLLIQKLKPGVEITPREAILMMAALKIRREVTKPKRDNRVDAIGYMLCDDWVTTGKKPTI